MRYSNNDDDSLSQKFNTKPKSNEAPSEESKESSKSRASLRQSQEERYEEEISQTGDLDDLMEQSALEEEIVIEVNVPRT